MNKILPIFGMMSSNLFFAMATIIGYEYTGIENSNVYVIYCLIVAILNIGCTVYYVFLQKKVITRKELIILGVPFIMILIHFWGKSISNVNVNFAIADRYLLFFLLWSVPSIYIAIYVKEKKLLFELVKYLECLVPIFTLAVVIAIIIPFISNISFYNKGNINYQTASYMAAFAYGINLYFILFGNNHKRFIFCKLKIYQILCYIMLFIELLAIFVSGGRGGMVLMCVYTSTLVLIFMKTKKINKIAVFVIIAVTSIIIVIISFPILMKNEMFYNGFNRATAFIGADGINWEGTSNRDIVYNNAIEYIKTKPILGYGIFNVFGITGYPHNLILELLLGGGMVYLFCSIFFFMYIFYKIYFMIREDCENMILLIIFLFPMTLLMFSGTYVQSAEFWFVISYVYIFK